MKKFKECAQCSVSFEDRTLNSCKRFCSKKCFRKAWNKSNPPLKIKKICPTIDCLGCKIPFTPLKIVTKYCSQFCYLRTWNIINSDRNKIQDSLYFQQNKSILRPKRTARHRERYQTDIQYRLKDILRSRLCKAVKNNQKSGSAVKDLGCSVEEFKAYIESKFKPGMTWENYGHGKNKWTIDHVLALSNFNLVDEQQVKLACNYTNLQPMWYIENIKKGNK